MRHRLVVVSHACVLAANQSVYAHLADQFDVTLVAPRRWRDELRPTYDAESAVAGIDEWRTVPVALRGRPQRYVALTSPARLLRHRGPQFVIIEEEPFSVAAWQFARAARRLEIPYAVQVAENLPRRLPRLVRRSARTVLSHASFVLARSPAALQRAREWGYHGPDTVVPHGVDDVVDAITPAPRGVVGFVGRLTDAKGVTDLVAAMEAEPTLTLRVAGEGPRRDALGALDARCELLGALAPAAMPAFYDSVAVVAVPSRTTPTWSEQFGRVIVEAQARGRAVVAFDSGEIPWVAARTAAVTVNEGDVVALARSLAALANDPAELARVGETGRDAVAENFTNERVAASLARLVHEGLLRP